MTRWMGKRGLWGVVAGVAVAGGALATEPGDTVVFKEGNKDRKVTVTKVNKKADGSLEVTGKDAVTGEVSSWIEGPTAAAPVASDKAANPVAAPTPPPAPMTPGTPPKAKARTEDPIATGAAPMGETPSERERRLFNGKLLGRDTPTPTPAAAAGAPTAPPVAEPKPGLLNRIFGKKSAPVPAAMPGPAVTMPTTGAKVMPSAGEPKVVAPGRPVVSPTPAPVVKTTPAPVSVPVPQPLPATRPPVQTAPPVAIPIPQPLPPVVPLPTIPGVPQSSRPGDPVHVVLPVGYVPPEVAMNDDLRPHTAVLHDRGAAVADRLVAARCLAEGRHGSTDRVKELLFAAAQADPDAVLRTACLNHLARLGYDRPDFMRHLQSLAEGAAGAERDAARAGLSKLTPRRW